jgi:hypothetical protein
VARPTTPVEIHQERLAEIAAKKARDRTAEDEREAKHAFLLEGELETKLAADLDELTNREQAAQHALAETEATEAAVASALGKVRLSKAEIALFDEKALSLQQVCALFAAYQKQCNSCYGALEAAEDNAKVLLAVQNSTKARLAEELAESEAKLAKQSTKTRMKKTELEALADMCTVAEERPAEVLLHATCEAATQEMKLQMATLATQLRVDEHARQQESVSEMARVLSGQQKRAEATQLIVQLINSKLDKDAEHIGRLHEPERAGGCLVDALRHADRRLEWFELGEILPTIGTQHGHEGLEAGPGWATSLPPVARRCGQRSEHLPPDRVRLLQRHRHVGSGGECRGRGELPVV